MNIGLVVPGFSADAADWCIPALRHLVRSLAPTDHVRVVAVRYPYRRARYAIDGADVIAVGGADARGPATLELWRTVFGLLRAEHARRPFDVLHAFWATESGLHAAIAGRVLGVPTLVSLAGGELVGLRDIGYGDQRVAWERMKVAASLRLATAVSAGSELLIELARRRVPARRLRRASLGVDLNLFRADQRAPGDPGNRIVHVGALTPVKDQALLLRALAELHHSGRRPTLDIVGDGPLRSGLMELADRLGVGESVCFRGAIDHAALPGVYREASVCVVSSRHEAQCMVALEATACGMALVGTRVGVVPELTCAVAPVGDYSTLAHQLAAVLDGASPSIDRELVEREFSLPRSAERFRALYSSIAGNSAVEEPVHETNERDHHQQSNDPRWAG